MKNRRASVMLSVADLLDRVRAALEDEALARRAAFAPAESPRARELMILADEARTMREVMLLAAMPTGTVVYLGEDDAGTG